MRTYIGVDFAADGAVVPIVAVLLDEMADNTEDDDGADELELELVMRSNK